MIDDMFKVSKKFRCPTQVGIRGRSVLATWSSLFLLYI